MGNKFTIGVKRDKIYQAENNKNKKNDNLIYDNLELCFGEIEECSYLNK